jgi:hypothetical protein
MRNSFKIFSIIIGLLIVLIILRLNSISYPDNIEGGTEVIYLEEFHDYSNLFNIELKANRYLLRPEAINIKVRNIPAINPVEINDNDLITIENRKFLFQIFPQKASFREVFRRPVVEVFPQERVLKYIGGWTATNRRKILSN